MEQTLTEEQPAPYFNASTGVAACAAIWRFLPKSKADRKRRTGGALPGGSESERCAEKRGVSPAMLAVSLRDWVMAEAWTKIGG